MKAAEASCKAVGMTPLIAKAIQGRGLADGQSPEDAIRMSFPKIVPIARPVGGRSEHDEVEIRIGKDRPALIPILQIDKSGRSAGIDGLRHQVSDGLRRARR